MKIRRFIVFLCLVFFLVFLIVETDNAVTASTNALLLCAKTIIPTLFPFFVISGLMLNLGLVEVLGKIFSPVSRFLFKTSGKGAVVFIIGILCGYPTGARVVAKMCKNNELTQEEGERLLAFCNNSGPLFVIGAVGSMMLKNHSIGVFLYIVHVISALLTGILLSAFAKKDKAKLQQTFAAKTIGEAVLESVESAVSSTLNVCGYVVFFGCLCAAIGNPFLVSILEVTTGAKALINLGLNSETTLILLSGIIGFGGICVAFQVQSAVSGTNLSVKTYIIGKIIQAQISMAITFLWLKLNKAALVFAPQNFVTQEHIYSVVIFLLGVVLMLSRLTKKS